MDDPGPGRAGRIERDDKEWMTSAMPSAPQPNGERQQNPVSFTSRR
jgi:hypothetical protein